jgi:hypothetical protein
MSTGMTMGTATAIITATATRMTTRPLGPIAHDRGTRAS